MDEMKDFFKHFNKRMEVFFDKQIIFPYMFLNPIQQQYDGYYDDTNIYMLMLCDKLEIIKAEKCKRYISVLYQNISNEQQNEVKLYYRDFLENDALREFVTLSIEKFGTALKVEVEENIFNVMKYKQQLPIDTPNFFICNIYDLITLCEREKVTSQNYQVVYIGKSKPKSEYKTIFDRLRRHEKVLEIFSDYNLEYRDKELMVFILRATTKLHNISGSLFLSSSEWQNYNMIEGNIDDTAILAVTEAMLIYHFKPLYNIKLKDTEPNNEMKVYKQLIEAGLDEIQVGLNLYLQPFKSDIILETAIQKTETRLRILTCDTVDLFEKKQESKIKWEDIENEWYDVIHG